MSTNIRNFGIAEGRLTRDPAVFNNTDGSRKIMVTLAVQDNFKTSDGKRNSQFINLEAFVSSKQANNGVFDYIHQGDLVGIEYTVRTNNYERDGQTIYSQVLFIQNVDLKESKRVTENRQNQRAGANEPAAEPMPASAVNAPAAAPEAAAPAPAPAPEAAPKSAAKSGRKKNAPAPEDMPFGQ